VGVVNFAGADGGSGWGLMATEVRARRACAGARGHRPPTYAAFVIMPRALAAPVTAPQCAQRQRRAAATRCCAPRTTRCRHTLLRTTHHALPPHAAAHHAPQHHTHHDTPTGRRAARHPPD
jgi:hypothetical protein